MVTDAAYARCLHIARQHYENFPVASRLLPRRLRPHIAAIYAFARIADDFADEGDRAVAARLALLDDWRERLHATAAGTLRTDDSDTTGIFVALGDTMRRFNLELDLLDDLLSAFRQDVTTTRYETWDDLLDYCRRSANPVGRLVLGIGGYRDAALDAQSDAVCTALQLTNFWQDIERRLGARAACTCRCASCATMAPTSRIFAGGDGRPTGARRSNRQRRARASCFADGRPVADLVRGRLRWELRATWLGGTRILDRLDARRFRCVQISTDARLDGRAPDWRARDHWRQASIGGRTRASATP